ncbi:MAG: hypothetical protein J6T01_05605 [Kiritimatiellae bacterium]|nr:hypothetical protein [Kiritimatiellia bacterium]
MKFIYEYRTSDNAQHEGVISAADREGVFAELKARGVRPFAVREAPGLVNKILGKGKRWLAIAVLAAIAAAAVAAAARASRSRAAITSSPLPRHQVYGDPALMAELVASDFSVVFPERGDRLLARYAQPGSPVPRLDTAAVAAAANDLKRAVAAGIPLSPDDPREINELKRIVMGMRGELRRYLANGVGTYETYIRRLEERQNTEAQIRARTETELGLTQDPEIWERRNAELRALGIRTVPAPEL